MMHDDSINVYNYVEREAERAVRSVAPRILGVKPNNLRCSQPVPDEEHQSDYQIRRSAAYSSSSSSDDSTDDRDGDTDEGDNRENTPESIDGSGSGEEPPESATNNPREETGPMCRGTLRPISQADKYLGDEDWEEEALFVEQLRRAYEDWMPLSETDRPPPIAQAFSG
jgi:hypothetical protein